MKTPLNIECPACHTRPGDLCHAILVDGTTDPTECLDFFHASRVEAAFCALDAAPARPSVPFVECPGCESHRRKPGAKVPCPACQQNRATIRQLAALLAEARVLIGEEPPIEWAGWLRATREVLDR